MLAMTAASPICSLLPRNAAPRGHSGVLAHNCVQLDDPACGDADCSPATPAAPPAGPAEPADVQTVGTRNHVRVPFRVAVEVSSRPALTRSRPAPPRFPAYLRQSSNKRITRAPPDWLEPTGTHSNTLSHAAAVRGAFGARSHSSVSARARELARGLTQSGARAGPPVRSYSLCGFAVQALRGARRSKARKGDFGPGIGSRAGEIRPDVSAAGYWWSVPPAVALRADLA